MVSTACLAFANLGKPSLWHDELVHVFVGKKIVETGLPLLLSGRVFTNGTLYNYLLAGVIAVFGDGEAAVRSIAGAFAVINVYLTYRVMRPLIGGPAAALTALLMAWSPWQLAWARQARFYMTHQTVYLVTMYCVWRFGEVDAAKTRRWGAAIVCAYMTGLFAGPQTIFFLGPIGAYAACRWFGARALCSRWTALLLICGVLGSGTLLAYYLSLPKAEHDAIFKEAIGPYVPDGPYIDH
ncbi:MAG: glycosyltransferase family 39 protein, partial [Candidatus Hydrogenedentes bacterium]|nr:glycosyltransferase family 39 protein [Candidatus Hydrogenedentota bacterium]